MEIRKELQKEVDVARSQGRNAVLRHDKIVYLEQGKTHKSNYHNSKRKSSKSPENQSNSTQFHKNKISFPQRTSKKTKIDMRNFLVPKEIETNSSIIPTSTQIISDSQHEQ